MKQLDSLRRFSVSVFLLFFCITASGGDPYRLPAGAAEAGMNYACIAHKSFWSSFQNQAILAFNKSFGAGFNYQDRFRLNELATKTAGIVLPAGRASLGGVYSYFGYPDFRRQSAGIACGLMLSEKLAAGTQVDYFSEMTYGEYDDRQLVTFELGLIFMASDKVMFGVHLFNPLPESVSKSILPSVIRTGAGVTLSSALYGACEIEMSTQAPMLIRTGFEYEAYKKLILRGGFCTENTSFSLGLGYRLGFVQMDVGFVTHDRLGITSSASMIFKIK